MIVTRDKGVISVGKGRLPCLDFRSAVIFEKKLLNWKRAFMFS